jgi:hypothetical protein
VQGEFVEAEGAGQPISKFTNKMPLFYAEIISSPKLLHT